jgi:MFS transporter, MCT family, aspergillic acid transporter
MAGVLFDKYGPRRLIIAGSVIQVFGMMMASLATEYYQFLLSQGVCASIGNGFLYTPGTFRKLSMIHFQLR